MRGLGGLVRAALVAEAAGLSPKGPQGQWDHGVTDQNGDGELDNAEIARQLPGFRTPKTTRPLIDPATPASAHKTTDSNTEPFNLIFSDEFNTAGRSFAAGADPYWTAVDHFNPTTSDLEYYTPTAVTTTGGNMVITATMAPDKGHPYTSGMVTSWNQFCMTGGIVEIKVQLPGNPANPGYWPAAWMMGNLARAGYTMTTDRTWPWSYQTCDGNSGEWQKFSACNNTLDNPNLGRGAPEFDILETNTCPTTSTKVGVNDLHRCPNDTATSGAYKSGPRLFSTMHFTPKNPTDQKYFNDGGISDMDTSKTHINIDGDVLHDFIGATTTVDDSLWTGSHVYRLEWQPSHEGTGGGLAGYVLWTLDGKTLARIDAHALRNRHGVGNDGNPFTVHDRLISKEPMYLLFNIAISDFWKVQDPAHPMQFPGELKIDYVRVYQDAGTVMTGDNSSYICSPSNMPTAEYIKAHAGDYAGTTKPPVMCNPNANPPQACPHGPCPKCGKPACPCPP